MKLKHVDIHHFKGLESVEIKNCGPLNAFIGKNNSGKSSILHAIDMAGLALSVRSWDRFQPKMEIRDLFADVGAFEMNLTFDDDRTINIKTQVNFAPVITPEPEEQQKYKSILILPDTGLGLSRREHRTPRWVLNQILEGNYSQVNSLEILYTIKFYGSRNEEGQTPESYEKLISEVIHYFPDLEGIESDRTEHDISTLTYGEYGRKLDILYSGTGLKHFLDVLLKTTISNASIVLLDEPEMGLHPDLQRRFLDYLGRLTEEKGTQFFLATQSQVLLNYADRTTFYRVVNVKGDRGVIPVPEDAIHTLLGDLGIRPSDVFNQDICLLVEGASEVVYFEHVIRILYKDEFDKVAVGIQQYGGGAADGIISGAINISNITPAQKYVFWTHDRDAREADPPATQATQFKNAIEKRGFPCHVWNKREIEYYYPETVHVAAQQGDGNKEAITRGILNGNQAIKYRTAAEGTNICVPTGVYLRKLLAQHLTSRDQLPEEVRNLIENVLLEWKREILGEE